MNTEDEQRADVGRSSLMKDSVLLFTEPSALFERKAVKPTWLFPVLLMIVLSIAGGLLLTDVQLKAQKEAILKSERFDEQQKSEILKNMDEGTGTTMRVLSTVLAGTAFIFLSYAVVSGLFLFTGNFIFGGEASFKQVFAVYAWGSLAGIPELLIKTPLMLMKDSIHVYTSLAVLMDYSQSNTWLFGILNAVDIFSIWRIVLWSVGLGIVYKFGSGKSYAITTFWYIVYVLMTLLVKNIFSGFLG